MLDCSRNLRIQELTSAREKLGNCRDVLNKARNCLATLVYPEPNVLVKPLPGFWPNTREEACVRHTKGFTFAVAAVAVVTVSCG